MTQLSMNTLLDSFHEFKLNITLFYIICFVIIFDFFYGCHQNNVIVNEIILKYFPLDRRPKILRNKENTPFFPLSHEKLPLSEIIKHLFWPGLVSICSIYFCVLSKQKSNVPFMRQSNIKKNADIILALLYLLRFILI